MMCVRTDATPGKESARFMQKESAQILDKWKTEVPEIDVLGISNFVPPPRNNAPPNRIQKAARIPTEERLYSVSQVLALAGISLGLLNKWDHVGKLKCTVKHKRERLYNQDALEMAQLFAYYIVIGRPTPALAAAEYQDTKKLKALQQERRDKKYAALVAQAKAKAEKESAQNGENTETRLQ